MRAISLWQPWASAIPAGLKTIETRSWSTAYRGPIAIHAAKRWTWQEKQFWMDRVPRAARPTASDAFRALGIVNAEDLPLGCIVATCEVYDCVSTNDDPQTRCPEYPVALSDHEWGNFGPNRFAWFLRNIKPLAKPCPCIGRQGFFEWEAAA